MKLRRIPDQCMLVVFNNLCLLRTGINHLHRPARQHHIKRRYSARKQAYRHSHPMPPCCEPPLFEIPIIMHHAISETRKTSMSSLGLVLKKGYARGSLQSAPATVRSFPFRTACTYTLDPVPAPACVSVPILFFPPRDSMSRNWPPRSRLASPNRAFFLSFLPYHHSSPQRRNYYCPIIPPTGYDVLIYSHAYHRFSESV